jgi:CheY-like chemotaxis protein/HPt (histidine-containing phosphotransfer) domain-containing protein
MCPTDVESGEAALACLREAEASGAAFDLMLLDSQMPEMDGAGVAERMRSEGGCGAPTIILLSSADHQDSRRCQAAGIRHYLTKPVTQSELLDAVVSALGASHPVSVPSLITHRPLREPGRRLRILLAEDNLVNQKLAVRMLEKWGHRVTVADDGRKALACVREAGPGGFDLILMDVQMPEMNGFEATAALREEERKTGSHIPIIAMTAHAMKGDQERCLAAGMDGYLSKPIDAAKLFEALERVDGPATGPPTPTPSVSPAETVWDYAAALERVGGDEDLLRETTGLLLHELPKLLGNVHAAVAGKDAGALERAAHKLKGAVSIFEARGAVVAARRLEELGRTKDLGPTTSVLQALEAEIDRLRPALASFTNGTAVTA